MGERLSLNPNDSIELVASSPEELEVEATYAPAGSPPPAHVHPAQAERFEVLSGSVRAVVDGEEQELEEGDELRIAAGQVHQMWNYGGEPARVRWIISPAGRTEEWFCTLDRVLGPEGAVAKGEEVDFATLLEEYSDVFRLRLD
ncbi:MAG TPA: cupin domain-containing protein [Solirubrobacterales bacterium]